MPRRTILLAAVVCATALRSACGLAEDASSPEARAVAFLAAEVPRWFRENRCYSCHNNGDAVRALIAASRAGLLADRAPLADTLRFLAAPTEWDKSGPEGPFQDKHLARIQFAGALADAFAAGLVADKDAPGAAAALVVEIQTAAGAWESGEAGSVGSPATYGRALATWMAMRALASLDAKPPRAAVDSARRWFETAEPKSVLDAAATLAALADVTSAAAQAQRKRSLDLIRRGQSSDGGWGPFASAPPEVFDTAVVMLALAAQQNRADFVPMLAAGRKYLLAHQTTDGSWPATTRPPGADSYAQRISTSAWATLALLATR